MSSNSPNLESFSDYNIILINLDGLRRDKFDLCPSLNSLKERSLFFSRMKTAAPYSIASLHSIFSGVYPSRHGVNGYYKMFRFKENEITPLTQYLKESDYYTSCDIINDKLIPKSGFDERHVFDEKTVDFKKRHREFIQRLSTINDLKILPNQMIDLAWKFSGDTDNGKKDDMQQTWKKLLNELDRMNALNILNRTSA